LRHVRHVGRPLIGGILGDPNAIRVRRTVGRLHFCPPAHEPPVLSRVHFEDWSKSYLDSDPGSRSRDPAGVKTPLGPFSEIIKA
jgi:hypothetical protein